jgi:hypothetical protein
VEDDDETEAGQENPAHGGHRLRPTHRPKATAACTSLRTTKICSLHFKNQWESFP